MAKGTWKESSDKDKESWFIQLAKYLPMMNVNYAGEWAKKVKEGLSGDFKAQSDEAWNKTLDEWIDKKLIDQDGKKLLLTINNISPAIKWLVQLYIMLSINFREINQTLDISTLADQFYKMSLATPNPAPVDALVRSMIIDPKRSTENRKEMKKHGFDDTQIDNIILSHYRTIEENTIRTMYLRGIIDVEKMYERMRELGYTDTRTKEIVQTWELLPSPQDLFLMVAHEAFEPDIYNKLGLNVEFPTEQVEWLKKQGISEDWARKFWIAHWEQPSIGQGFEMLHRGVIDDNDLDILFRTVEIPSYWREKLTKIAYSPYTRVDVRRMHDLGVLNDEQLLRAYKDLGYDDEKAANMVEFTIKYNEDTQKQLTQSTVLTCYNEDLIDKNEARQMLIDQGYTYEVAGYYLDIEDYKKAKEYQDLWLGNLKDQYLLGMIDADKARSSMNQAGFRGEKIDNLLAAWNLDFYKYQRLPSKSDLDRFLVKGIITDKEYVNYMQQSGFTKETIAWYLKDMEGELYQKGRAPTRADVETWYKKKIISELEFRNELKAMGYDDRYIGYLIKELGRIK